MIWVWIKKILFAISMLLCILISIGLFIGIDEEFSATPIAKVLNIALILLAIVNTVLYFIMGDNPHWSLKLLITAQLFINFYLAFCSGVCGISAMGSTVGLLIVFGVKQLQEIGKKLSGK